EFIQMRRDKLTFAVMLGMPLVQLMLFGFAINTDPKILPTAVVAADSGPVTRSLVSALQATGYFKLDRLAASPAEADRLLARGQWEFVITIPEDFDRDYVRGARPQLLIEADATDPVAISGAVSAAAQAQRWLVDDVSTGTLADMQGTPQGFEVVVHRRYNP